MISDAVWDVYAQIATATPGFVFDLLFYGPTILVVFVLKAVGL